MVNMYRKKLQKIYKKLDDIASKGRDNQIEYFKYIDELIDKGDYVSFEEVLLVYYNLDVSKERDVDSYKRDSWNIICQKTKPSFLSKLSNLYKKEGIYQSSFNIYRDKNSELIGQIKEKEVLSKNAEYYIKNKQYARLTGERKTYLEVKKISEDNYILIDDDDLNTSEENNLLNRYKTAISYLKNNT